MSAFGGKAYAVFRIRDFRYFVAGRFFLTIATQMQAIIVSWQVYEITRDPFSLGLIGLAEAIPFISIALFAGHVADIIPRKRLILFSSMVFFLCALSLYSFITFMPGILLYGVVPIYGVIFISGIARSFFYPSQAAFMAQIVPRELYVNSSTWNSTVWHIAAVTGPAIGGLLYGFLGIRMAYFTVILFAITGIVFFFTVHSRPIPPKTDSNGLYDRLMAGLRFVFSKQVILGAMALDMFGVLFGGAVAMLPVFAKDILHTGPQGLGFLRSAPAIGAVMMALVLAYKPPLKHAGVNLFIGVAGFGMSIILFAISKSFLLSFLLLMMSGIFDNISVIIRHSIMQLFTPDSMRGRVAAVNSIFIGSSNELGSFESGLAARILGLIPSVIFGGAMTLAIVFWTTGLAPKLRKLNLTAELSKETED